MNSKLDRKMDPPTPTGRAMPLPRWAYRDGTIVPYREAAFGLLTHALNYGTGLFAGLRGYWNPEEGQLFVFRPEDHFRRFCDSARLLRMELGVTPADLPGGLPDLRRAQGHRDNCHIRPRRFDGHEPTG